MIKLIKVLLVVFAIMGHESFAEQSAGQQRFETLRELLGTWVKKDDASKDFQIRFEMTANDTALVENWLFKGTSQSLTIYHLDNGILLATHYCRQGNQPRLAMLAESDDTSIRFSFRDATNLDKTTQSYLTKLELHMDRAHNILRRDEVYQTGEREVASELLLMKIR